MVMNKLIAGRVPGGGIVFFCADTSRKLWNAGRMCLFCRQIIDPAFLILYCVAMSEGSGFLRSVQHVPLILL
jgi:hypothetical protein